MKRIDFWGRDENDERLLEEVLRGIKTVTCTPKVWYDRLPEEEKSQVGDIFHVYTKKNEHKANILLTDVYEIPFGEITGEIGERIAKGENSTLHEFIEDHIFSWEAPLKSEGVDFGPETRIVVEHFKLLEVFCEVNIDFHIIPIAPSELEESSEWDDYLLNDESEQEDTYYFAMYKEKNFVALLRYRNVATDSKSFMYFLVNPTFRGKVCERDIIRKGEEYAKTVLHVSAIIQEWCSSTYKLKKS